MLQSERFDVLVLGSGTGGKLIAWYMAQSGRRTAVVERRWVGATATTLVAPTRAIPTAAHTVAVVRLSN